MLYKIDMPTPANTSSRAPLVWRVRVHPGVTRRIWVGFPPGCKGLCHVQIRHAGWPVWPWAPEHSFHWDDYMFTFEDHYPLTAEPFGFEARTWNLDDMFEHTPTFAVSIEPSPLMLDVSAIEMIMLNRRLMMEGR